MANRPQIENGSSGSLENTKLESPEGRINVDLAAERSEFTPTKTETRENTSKMVENGVLPDTTIDFSSDAGNKSKAPDTNGDKPVGNRESAGSEGAEAKGGDGGGSTLDGRINAPESFVDPFQLENTATKQDMATASEKIVAASGNPEEQGRIFEEMARKFKEDNPGLAGSTFATEMRETLLSTPGSQGLDVEVNGSEGERDGNTEVNLVQTIAGQDGKPEGHIIGSENINFNNGATRGELAQIGENIKQNFPELVNELQGPESLNNILTAGNDLVKAQAEGSDMSEIFKNAVSEFNRMNPDASGSTFARLLSLSLEQHPQPKGLAVGTQGSEGVNDGSVTMHLLDLSKDKKGISVAQQFMEFGKNR